MFSEFIKDTNLNENNDEQNKFDRHKEDVNRVIMERSSIFQNNSNVDIQKTYNDKYNKNNKNLGEITGEHIQIDELEQGLPMRKFMTENKKYNEDDIVNPFLDFNLYDSSTKNNNISYYDPNTTTNIFEISNYEKMDNPELDKNITNDKVDETNDNNLINKLENYNDEFNSFIYKELCSIINTNFVVSPYSILLLLITLYRSSKGETEQQIKYFFNDFEKNMYFNFMSKTNSNILKNEKQSIFISNSIVVSNELELDFSFQKYITNILVDLVNEVDFNYDKHSNNFNLKKSFVIEKKELNDKLKIYKIILISEIHIKPQWDIPFLKSETKILQFLRNNKIIHLPMMRIYNNNFKYYKNEYHQMIEIPYDEEMVFGVILQKNTDNFLNINFKTIKHYISNLSITNIRTLAIPKFSQKNKLNLKSLFKKNNLYDILNDADLSTIYTKALNVSVGDIIQDINITIDDSYIGTVKSAHTNNKNNKNNKNIVDFIANKSFIYYSRHVVTNAIIFIGIF
jgi:serine protease inhibitor